MSLFFNPFLIKANIVGTNTKHTLYHGQSVKDFNFAQTSMEIPSFI